MCAATAISCSHRVLHRNSDESGTATSKPGGSEPASAQNANFDGSQDRAAQEPRIRESRQVAVGEAVERWSIEWSRLPQLTCLRKDCACSEFGYAQRGEAELVRYRGGARVEGLWLARIYQGDLDLPSREPKEAILPAWPFEIADASQGDDAVLVEAAQRRSNAYGRRPDASQGDDAVLVEGLLKRELIPLMELRDYDHDGRATEFLLPVGGVGCAFHGNVAVGLSRSRPELHVLGSALHPNRPIVLTRRGWQLLQTSKEGSYVQYECGFRGGDTQEEVELRADASGIHVVTIEYACPRNLGRVLSRNEQ